VPTTDNPSGTIINYHLLLKQHVKIMEVAVTPPDVPLLDNVAAVTLLLNTDEVHGVLHSVLHAWTCHTVQINFTKIL